MRDFRLPAHCEIWAFWDFSQGGMIAYYLLLQTNYGSHLQGSRDCLTLYDGTYNFLPKCRLETTALRSVKSQKSTNPKGISSSKLKSGCLVRTTQ